MPNTLPRRLLSVEDIAPLGDMVLPPQAACGQPTAELAERLAATLDGRDTDGDSDVLMRLQHTFGGSPRNASLSVS